MSYAPFCAVAPTAHAGPADARSSSVESCAAEVIDEPKKTAVAADIPAAAIAADTQGPAPAYQATAATAEARQAFGAPTFFRWWKFPPAPATISSADCASVCPSPAPSPAPCTPLQIPPVVLRALGELQEEKGSSCGDAAPVEFREAWADCEDNDEANNQQSDDGVGATTEDELAQGNCGGLVERRTANAQPKERHKGNRTTGESSYKYTGGDVHSTYKKQEVGDF